MLAGSGSLSTTGGGHSIDIESRYALRITVDEATPFVFDADFSFLAYDNPYDSNFPPNPLTQALARLSSTSTDLLSLHEAFPEFIGPPTWELAFEHHLPFVSVGDDILLDGSGLVSERGMLLPGQTYLLEVSERAYREQSVDQTGFSFTFAVPEPGSVGLLGTGLALLAWGSRRRNR